MVRNRGTVAVPTPTTSNSNISFTLVRSSKVKTRIGLNGSPPAWNDEEEDEEEDKKDNKKELNDEQDLPDVSG
ncbi:hypothetical protein M0802_006200 [Mischocyttarus mexicanus]|nr:hypothetical protein M0802_006200 [Mischocyttarus mexicanus]